MEVIILCVTITSIMAIMLVGIGVALARMDKGELDGDTDTRLYVPSWHGNRRGDNGCDKSVEIIGVLKTIRTGTSRTEKEAIDYAIESITIRDKVEKCY